VIRALGISMLLLWTGAAWATPVVTDVVVFQNGGATSVSLGATPGALVGPSQATLLIFGVVISDPLTAGGTLDATVALTGGPSASFHETLPTGIPAYTLVGFDLDTASCCVANTLTPGTVNLSIVGGAASTFRFTLVSPVPEPGTLALLGGGAAALGWRLRRRHFATPEGSRSASPPATSSLT